MSWLASSSLTVTLNGTYSALSSYFHPDIELDDRYNYSLALLEFHTYNSIPNVTKANNKFIVRQSQHLHVCHVPEGSYELAELIAYINQFCADLKLNVTLEANKNTFKCTVKADKELAIDFRDSSSLGSLLGFEKRKLKGSAEYTAQKIVNIQSVNTVRINCDLTTGSYHNSLPSHTIYEFSPSVGPGHKINECPVNLIYFPITRKSVLAYINITVCDQDDNLIDFRGENITCRVHIKRENL